jgi:PKD repeat protein
LIGPGRVMMQLTCTDPTRSTRARRQEIPLIRTRLALFLGASAAIWSLAASPVAATPAPKAALSIDEASGSLTVKFLAQSGGMSSPVSSYLWEFGDGHATTSSSNAIVHAYSQPGTYTASVTVTDTGGQTATTSGTLVVAPCPAGTTQCRAAVQSPSGVTFIQASGPVGSAPAEVNVFSGSWRFVNCDGAITPAGSVTDSGFTGPLSVTFVYRTTNPIRVQRTCFASVVAFVDSGGASVHSGALPMCVASNPTPPCVQTIQQSGSQVTKTLLIPAGDPRFGS